MAKRRSTFNLTEVDLESLTNNLGNSGDARRRSSVKFRESKREDFDDEECLKRDIFSGRDYYASDSGSSTGSSDDGDGGFGIRSEKHQSRDRKRRPTRFADEESSRTMDIMMLLDIDKVPVLQKEFEAEAEGLTMANFVRVMMKYLKRSDLDDHQLVSNLCELFAQIDINGDGTMEWDEFTSFIVDTGNIAVENEPNSIQSYSLSSWVDDAKHNSMVEHVYYFGGNINKIGTCEANGRSLRLLNPETLSFDSSISLAHGNVICAEHMAGAAQFALSSTNLSINLFDDSSHRPTRSLDTDTSQTCLQWAQDLGLLFSAGMNGIVHAWNPTTASESHCMGGVMHEGKSYLSRNSHTDMVLDLLQISSLESLTSASMDKTIKLWDIVTGKHKKTLEGHIKGVRSLAYSSEYRFMVSAGFDFDAYVWNPYVEHLILRLPGHNAPLCKVEIIENTPQILTADVSGTFKVWDIRNFGCVQTFSTEGSDVRDFCAVTPEKTLVSAGRRLHHFEYEKLKNPELSDDLPVFKAILNPTTMTILTASGRDVRIWDARKGTLINRFRGLLDSRELCCVCLDDRERKFIVGDHHGHIMVYDYISGTAMKAFAYPDRAHVSEVSNVIYCNEYKVVISSGWDDTIMVHDEIDPEEGILLRKMQGGHHGSDITALAFSQKLGAIASGSPSAKASIIVWGFEFGRIEAVLNPDITSSQPGTGTGQRRGPETGLQGDKDDNGETTGKSVAVLCFVDEKWPGLVSADGAGGVIFWAIRPAQKWRNRSLCRLVNRHNDENAPVTALCIDQMACKLYTADEKGYIKIWDYSILERKVIDEIGGAAFKAVECENPRRKIHIDVTAQNELARQNASAQATREAQDARLREEEGRESKERDNYSSFRAAGKATEARHTGNANNTALFRAGSVVTTELCWLAHSDAILSLQLVLDEERSCLISASHDCLVRIFDLKGMPLGTLRQGESMSGLNWVFRMDVASRRETQFKQADSILKEIGDLDDTLDDKSGAISDTLVNAQDILALTSSDSSMLGGADNLMSLDRGGPVTYSDTYARKTPRLKPINPKMAGKGLSNTLKGKEYRSKYY